VDTAEFDKMFEVEETNWWYRGRRHLVTKWVKRHFERQGRPLRILDIACATGMSFRFLSKYGDIRGIDISEETIRLCKTRGIDRIVRCDAMKLPFRDGSFDTVLCLELLEHVPDPHRCLDEIARTLRPGGALLVTVPFVAALHALPYDYWRYTPAGLTALLARHGLEIESLVPRGNVASAAASMTAQYLLRAVGAGRSFRDGSIAISRWRAPFVLPLIALSQGLFALLERLTTDSGACLGYTVVARRRS